MKIKDITLCGILTAAALIIFTIEAHIPSLVPIPGIKLGLSNVVTLFALLYLSPAKAFYILISRILLGAFIIGAPSTLLYSLAGGIGCLISEVFLLKFSDRKYIWGISAAGAMIHNTVQLVVASLVTQTLEVFFYLPYLLISGIITGLFTGLCIYYFNLYFLKHKNKHIR